MKKFILSLIAFLLMACSAGAIGANDVELENTHLAFCSNPKYSDTELESGYAHSDSDHMFRQYVLRYCKTCGAEYGKELISNRKRNVVTFEYLNAEKHRIACTVCDWYYDAKHIMENGECKWCDIPESVCDHDDYTDNAYYAGEKKIEYSKITDTTHDEKHPYRRTCDACGEVLKEGHFPAVTEKHSFKNGVCACGYEEETECKHKYYTDEEYYGGKYQTEFSKITETTHDVKNPYRRTCDDCGEVLKEDHFPAVTETHTFKNGVCACGYEETDECTTHDFRYSKCQKCGFTAYISLSQDTAQVGDTIKLSTNLPKGDYTFSVGKNLSLSGNKATAVAAGKGNVWLYYKGGSNSVASCVVEIECTDTTHVYGAPTWSSYQYSDEREHMSNGTARCTLCGHLENVSECEPHSGDSCICGYSKNANAYALAPQSNYFNTAKATLQMAEERVEVQIYDSTTGAYRLLSDIPHLDIEFSGTNIHIEKGSSIYFVRDDVKVAAEGTLTLVDVFTGDVVDSINVLGLVLFKEKDNWLFVPDFTTKHTSTVLITSDQAEENTKGKNDILLYEAPALVGDVLTGSDCLLSNYDRSDVHYDMPDKFPAGYYVVTIEAQNNTTMVWGVGARYSDGQLVDDDIQWINAYSTGVGIVSTNAKYIEGLLKQNGDILDAISEVSTLEIKVPVGGYIDFFKPDINANMNDPEAKVFAVNVLDMMLRICSFADLLGNAKTPDADGFMTYIDEKQFYEGFAELVQTGAIDPKQMMFTLSRDGIIKSGMEYLGNEQWWPLVQSLIKDCTYNTGDTIANAALVATHPMIFVTEFMADSAVRAPQYYEKVLIMDPEEGDPRKGAWFVDMIALPDE